MSRNEIRDLLLDQEEGTMLVLDDGWILVKIRDPSTKGGLKWMDQGPGGYSRHSERVANFLEIYVGHWWLY